MSWLWNVNWLNQNSQRSYPLSDTGDKQCVYSPEICIPDDFLLALRLSVHTGHNIRLENFFLKSITVAGDSCTVVFGYNDNAKVEKCSNVATVHFTKGTEVVNCEVVGVGDFADTVGYAVFNSGSPIFDKFVGYFLFSPTSTPLEPDCIVPMLKSVSSVGIYYDADKITRYYGDIVLRAGNNIRILETQENGSTVLTINAEATDDFIEGCTCDLHETAPSIRSIGGATPGSSGVITFTGTDCTEVTCNGNTITVKDSCAQPDCGCNELEALGEKLREMEDGIKTINNFVEALNSKVQATNLKILSSHPGCVNCEEEQTSDSPLINRLRLRPINQENSEEIV